MRLYENELFTLSWAVLKGKKREMVSLTISLYPRYKIRIIIFVLFFSNFGFIYRIRRVRQDCLTTCEDFIGSIIQPFEITFYIRAVREQNAIKIFCLHNRKISLCVFSLSAK